MFQDALLQSVESAGPNELVKRRMHLLESLADIQKKQNRAIIVRNVPIRDVNAVTVTDLARKTVGNALADSRRQENESSGVALLRYGGVSDGHFRFAVSEVRFENIGTPDSVEPVQRDTLPQGIVEIHTHVPGRPDYLHQVDIPDLIGALEGPAFENPATGQRDAAFRLFGIMSILGPHEASMQLYSHDLRAQLSSQNAFGLARFGNPVRIEY